MVIFHAYVEWPDGINNGFSMTMIDSRKVLWIHPYCFAWKWYKYIILNQFLGYPIFRQTDASCGVWSFWVCDMLMVLVPMPSNNLKKCLLYITAWFLGGNTGWYMSSFFTWSEPNPQKILKKCGPFVWQGMLLKCVSETYQNMILKSENDRHTHHRKMYWYFLPATKLSTFCYQTTNCCWQPFSGHVWCWVGPPPQSCCLRLQKTIIINRIN